ncbi:hypothetical protein HYV49_03885 [Candidatus Pacearchaeota archaeon]|nr:hypothetical protein [Candidatus Pacearchaeota archaeon]
MFLRCKFCKEQHLERDCPFLKKLKEFSPRIETHFSGSSPPEIFVGRYNYPNVFTGVLSPSYYGNTEELSMPEIWYEKKLAINDILAHRASMIYARFVSNIKKATRYTTTMQEIAMASRSVSSEFQLAKRPHLASFTDTHTAIIGNPAPLESIRLEENPYIDKKVDYLVSDTDAKATNAIQELYKSKIPVSNIIKILSSGLLGLKKSRKLVPTRWSVTATDDIITKHIMQKIKSYQELGDFRLFHSEYLGNHYELIILPDVFSFEVIEIRINEFNQPKGMWTDYESVFGRKKYAYDVTGAYYSNRLAFCEYLEKIKRQASCIVLREINPEYYAPLGVGILREASRDAFSKKPEVFPDLKSLFKQINTRLKININNFLERSKLLANFRKQKRLSEFIN